MFFRKGGLMLKVYSLIYDSKITQFITNHYPEGESSLSIPQAAKNSGVCLEAEISHSEDFVGSPEIAQDSRLCLESFGRSISFQYPIRQIQHKGKWFQEYRLYHILASENECWKNLLWKSLFKGISVDEFIILEYILVKKWSTLNRPEKVALVEILVLINTRERLTRFTSRLGSAASGLRKKEPHLDKKEVDSFLQEFVSKLKLPTKGINIEFQVLENEYKVFSKPPPVAFIGVGYKDKGSLLQDPKPEYDPADFEETTTSFFEEFSSLRKHQSRW
jgi:hypothetical protein